MEKLLYGGVFSDVYTWEGVKRTKPDWTNFNKIISLTADEQQVIDDLLKREIPKPSQNTPEFED